VDNKSENPLSSMPYEQRRTATIVIEAPKPPTLSLSVWIR